MTEPVGRPYEIAVSDSSSVFAYFNNLSSVFDTGNDKVECKIDLIEKVCDQRILFNSSSVRRLIIEMYSVFQKSQKMISVDKAFDTLTSCTLSRFYRSIILNAAISHNSQEFKDNFALWSLYEKLYLNRGDGSICSDLISWANESFTFVKAQVEKSAEECNSNSIQNENYWRGVAVSLLCCHFKECSELLSLISGDPAVDRFLDTLSLFDSDYLLDEAMADKIAEWKEILRDNLKYGKYGSNENIIFLTKLLLGDEKYLQTMASRVMKNWWHFVPFYVLAKNPFANYNELVNLAESCRECFFDEDDETEENKIENDVFWCLISRDEANFYQHITSNPWLSVHLIDLIQKSTNDQELEDLRKSLMMNYASSLILHSELWEIGIGYLIACGTEGLLRLESHIEGIHIEDDEMAEKLLDVCEVNRLDDGKSCVCNTMAFRYLKQGEWSASLGWALRSGNKRTIDTVVSRIVCLSHRQELASLNILDSLSTTSVLSLPSLTFLYSYQRFVKTMHSGEVLDCVKHLIPLIMMSDVPTQYYYDLFDYLIAIIKEDDARTGIKFPKEILYELSTFLATFSMDKNAELDEKYTKKVKVLKKMVMLKLAESISKGIAC